MRRADAQSAAAPIKISHFNGRIVSDFSANLRRLRKKAGLSQDALAERLSVTRQTVSSWERDKSYPDIPMLLCLGETLGVSPNDLLYPAGRKQENSGAVSLFRCAANLTWLLGLIQGFHNGSRELAPFVLSDAVLIWLPCLVLGLIFWGIKEILLRLEKFGGEEQA